MKKILTLFFLLVLSCEIFAQQADTVKYWTRSGVSGINLSQVALSNWSAGGDASIAFDVNFAYSLDYNKDKTMWKNRIEMAYGMSNTSSLGTRKTNDKIYLSSTYGYKIAKEWYLSAFVNFNSQFANGFDYNTPEPALLSQFMAPGYVTAGLGFTWVPKAWFTATFSPSAWRGTFVLNEQLSDVGAFGVSPGSTLRSEFGANVTMEAKYEFLPNMTIYSRLILYSNYLDKPQNVDVNWDTQLTMKVNKWFSANLNLSMIYDDNTIIARSDGTSGPALQFREVLGIGFQVNF